jgi:hypothetical protein
MLKSYVDMMMWQCTNSYDKYRFCVTTVLLLPLFYTQILIEVDTTSTPHKYFKAWFLSPKNMPYIYYKDKLIHDVYGNNC